MVNLNSALHSYLTFLTGSKNVDSREILASVAELSKVCEQSLLLERSDFLELLDRTRLKILNRCGRKFPR